MKRWLLISICLIPCAALAEPSPDSTVSNILTLKEAREIALHNHPRLHSAEYTTRAANEEVTIARSGYFPQVTGDAERVYAGDNTHMGALGALDAPEAIERGSAGVGVSQLITDFGRTNHLVDAAKAQAEAQAARMLSQQDQVLFNVTSAYYNVLRAQKVMKVAKATLSTRRSLLDQIGSLRNAKIKSDLDVGIAKQTVSQADLLVLQAQNDLDDAQAELAQSLGYKNTQHFTLKDETNVIAPPPNLESLLEQAENESPDLKALRAQRNAAQKQQEADEAANYPTVSAIGTAGANPIHNNQIDANYAAAGINISIPFTTGGRITATEERSAYQAQALEQDISDRKNQLSRDVRVSWNNMLAAYKNISVSKELQSTSDEALELTQARYNLGKSSIVDLAEVQLSQTQAEIAYSNATYAYLIDRALLEYKIGGTINEAVVAESNIHTLNLQE